MGQQTATAVKIFRFALQQQFHYDCSSPQQLARRLSSLAASTSAAPSRAGATAALQPHQQPLDLIPDHELEEGLPVLEARLRPDVSKYATIHLRRGRRIPGSLFSLPGNHALAIDMQLKDAAKWVRTFGRNGILARVMQLNIVDGTAASEAPDAAAGAAPAPPRLLKSVRVLPRQVYVEPRSLQLESINFMYCPQERVVDVPIPVRVSNEDLAPAIKKGGWFHVVNRTVAFRCRSTAIPPVFDLDVRALDVHDVIRMRDLPAPDGCVLAAPDGMQPVVRVTIKVGAD